VVPGGDVTGPVETAPVETGPVETTGGQGPGSLPVSVTDYLVDLETGTRTPLPESIVGTYDVTSDYAVSPDGSRLAYTGPTIGEGRGKAIFVANLDGTGVEQVTSVDPGLDSAAGGSEPAWSPDGSRIAYVERRDRRTSNVVVLDLATGETTQVTDEPDGGGAFAPTFTPDGESIIYSSGAYHDQILAVPVAGGPSVLLLGGDGASAAQQPALSPDGSLLSYVCGDVLEVSTGICLANADGSGARVFVPVAYVSGPEWSPDGKWIAYWTWPFDVYVYVVEVATGEVTTVGGGARPTWLDGHTLIVEADHCNLPPHDRLGCGY
jgi:Tol biopolymer transport system component